MTFSDFVLSQAKAVVVQHSREINGIVESAVQPYLIKSKYGSILSTTGRWDSYMSSSTYVMSDWIALDSPFPIKRRPSLRIASGEIVKIGSMRILNETQQKEVDRLLLSTTDAAVRQAAQYLIADIVACQLGIYETLESMVYQTLSNEGVAMYAPTNVPADLAAGAKDNVGIGFRVDFGMDPKNKLNITIPWSDSVNSTPITDINNIVKNRAQTAGIRIIEARTNRSTLDRLLNSTEMKNRFWGSMNVGNPQEAGAPTVEQANAYFLANFGFQFVIMDRPFIQERDGIQTSVDMWNDGAIAFLSSNTWGDVVWEPTNEARHPIPTRNYIPSGDDMVLLAMWDESPYNASFMHISQGQAEAITVTNCAQLITLDTLNPAA